MPFSRWRLGSLLTWSPSVQKTLSRPYAQDMSRVWVRPTVSFGNRLTAPEIRLVWLPRGWLSSRLPGPHTFCDLDQDLDYLYFFLFYAPRPHLQDRSLNPPGEKKTWISRSMLSSDPFDPDLLSVSRHTENLVPAVANYSVKRHSLPTAHCSSPDNVQDSVSDAILKGVSPIP